MVTLGPEHPEISGSKKKMAHKNDLLNNLIPTSLAADQTRYCLPVCLFAIILIILQID